MAALFEVHYILLRGLVFLSFICIHLNSKYYEKKNSSILQKPVASRIEIKQKKKGRDVNVLQFQGALIHNTRQFIWQPNKWQKQEPYNSGQRHSSRCLRRTSYRGELPFNYMLTNLREGRRWVRREEVKKTKRTLQKERRKTGS